MTGTPVTFEWWYILVALLPMLPTFWSIWHIWSHAFSSPLQRSKWLVLVVFLPVIGGLIYIFAGRSKAGKKLF